MDKVKLLTIIIIGLILVNLGALSFLFFSGPKNGRDRKQRPMPREIIIEKLHFDDRQIAAYDKTIKIHQKTIEKLDRSIRQTKNELYGELTNKPVNAAKKDSLIAEISAYQKEIENTHFNHFLEIKVLCYPEQLDEYDQLTDELSKIFSHPTGPKK